MRHDNEESPKGSEGDLICEPLEVWDIIEPYYLLSGPQ